MARRLKLLNHKTHMNQACTILPSADQSPAMKGQAAYIAKYPSPITIDG